MLSMQLLTIDRKSTLYDDDEIDKKKVSGLYENEPYERDNDKNSNMDLRV